MFSIFFPLFFSRQHLKCRMSHNISSSITKSIEFLWYFFFFWAHHIRGIFFNHIPSRFETDKTFLEEEIPRQIINEKVIAQNNSFLNHTIWIINLFVFFCVCLNTCMTIFGRKIKVIERIITFHFRKWTQWNHYLCMRLKSWNIFWNSIDQSIMGPFHESTPFWCQFT